MTLPTVVRRDANPRPGQGAHMSLLTRLALTVAVAFDGLTSLRRRPEQHPATTPLITGSITTTRTSTP